MKRQIKFPEGHAKNQSRFEILVNSILVLQQEKDDRSRGIAVMRQEARVQDALDSVSDETKDVLNTKDASGTPFRQVRPGSVVELTQEDFSLLDARVKAPNWLPSLSRRVVDVIDWLATAAEIE